MARPLRIEYPGAVYHITSRGNRRDAIFIDEEDHAVFFKTLGETVSRFHALCHAYCLMGNHYHLLLEAIEGNLCRAMRHLNGVYTQVYNKRHSNCGHLFQGRYKAILIEKESHLLEACRYVVLNPVRAGLAAAPVDWAWSSYRATAGLEAAPKFLTTEWLLGQFGDRFAEARCKYAEFVNDGDKRRLWEDIVAGLALGGRKFTERCRLSAHDEGDITEVPRKQRYLNRPGLAELMEITEQKGVKWLRAIEEYGYTQTEVASHCGVHYSYVSRILKRERSKVKT